METFKLRYFVSAYQERSYTRAAQKHFVARQSLRHAIASIEEQLGVPLFEVQGKVLVPTLAAERLYAAALQLLEAQRLFESKLEEIAMPPTPQLVPYGQACGIQEIFTPPGDRPAAHAPQPHRRRMPVHHQKATTNASRCFSRTRWT